MYAVFPMLTFMVSVTFLAQRNHRMLYSLIEFKFFANMLIGFCCGFSSKQFTAKQSRLKKSDVTESQTSPLFYIQNFPALTVQECLAY